MEPPVDLRQLRYFVAVAEELHFGRAAERVHMSQSPLSRAIRELERGLGVTLFLRTTRRVELTPAGSALLERARLALAEVDLAVEESRRAARSGPGAARIGHGPFTQGLAKRLADALPPAGGVRFDEDVTQELLRCVAARELDAAVVFETPAAAQRHDVRIDRLRDEPLLAALPAAHALADAATIPAGVFAAEQVLLPREPTGKAFNAWLRARFRIAGVELSHTRETPSAPWDHRMLPVARGEAVSVVVDDWTPIAGVVALPFEPPLTMPFDLASCRPPTAEAELLVETATRLRDQEGWLSERPGV